MSRRPATLFETILYLTRAIRAGFELRVRAQGLTYARARLLAVIGHNQGASQAEMAQLLEIETPTLKRQLDALEALDETALPLSLINPLHQISMFPIDSIAISFGISFNERTATSGKLNAISFLKAKRIFGDVKMT